MARLISLNPTLRSELEEKAASVIARAEPAHIAELSSVLRQNAKMLAVPDQTDEGWTDLLGAYLDFLAPVPIEAIRQAFVDWHHAKLYPKDPGRCAFFPKPAEIFALAEPKMMELKMAAYRVRKALTHVEENKPRVKTPEDAEAIKRMLAEFRGSPKTLGDPDRPRESPQQVAARLREYTVPVGPSGLSAAMREKMGLGPEREPDDDPGLVL